MVSINAFSQLLPKPTHIVICVLENHKYKDIIGSKNAPYINSLADSGTLFGNYYALTHPSQPNYLLMFSGDAQGVINSTPPKGFPFKTQNLGACLLVKGYSFKGYSEDLPKVGDTIVSSGDYVRRHCPWVYWLGKDTNQLPDTVHQPLTAFPHDYDSLPTVSFVIPNLYNDMHNASVAVGDAWVKKNLDSFVRWANSHNSLFILTFDEDDDSANNNVVAIFSGAGVKRGFYDTTHYTHYNLLRTLEEIYSLPYAGKSDSAVAIKDCWIKTTAINENPLPINSIKISYQPVTNSLFIEAANTPIQKTEIYNVEGKLVYSNPSPNTLIPLDENLPNGMYLIKVFTEKTTFTKKLFVGK